MLINIKSFYFKNAMNKTNVQQLFVEFLLDFVGDPNRKCAESKTHSFS